MFHCRHWDKRKAPGRLSPGPAVPLLTRGLIRDRHANACAQNGAFLGLAPPRRSHLLPLLAHRYSLPTAAPLFASTSQPHASVTPQCAAESSSCGDGARSLLISIRQEQTERSQDRAPNCTASQTLSLEPSPRGARRASLRAEPRRVTAPARATSFEARALVVPRSGL
jgi:hypothetical protein